MVKKALTSPLMARAEVLLAIGLPTDALGLYRQVAGTERQSIRSKALQLRLLASAGQWQQGLSEAAKVKHTDSLLLRQAGGRFFLSSMQNCLRQGDVAKAEECCKLACDLWPEGHVDYLEWGLKPPAAEDYQATETSYQIERISQKRAKLSPRPPNSGLQAIQTSALKFRLATERPSHKRRLRGAASMLPGRFQGLKQKIHQRSTGILAWGRLMLARLRPLLTEVNGHGLASPSTARISGRGF